MPYQETDEKKRKSGTHIRSNPRQDIVNRSTHDIITPSFIVRAIWLLTIIIHAGLQGGVLSIVPGAGLLDLSADGIDGGGLNVRAGCRCAAYEIYPGLQVGDPSFVVDYCTEGIETPESNLYHRCQLLLVVKEGVGIGNERKGGLVM